MKNKKRTKADRKITFPLNSDVYFIILCVLNSLTKFVSFEREFIFIYCKYSEYEVTFRSFQNFVTSFCCVLNA